MRRGINISFIWVSGHVNIKVNEIPNKAAEEAATQPNKHYTAYGYLTIFWNKNIY